MPILQEHLFVSNAIPGLDNPEVINVLRPTIEDLRAYFAKRDKIMQENGEAFDVDAFNDAHIHDLELMVLQEITPTEAIIMRDGEVLIGARLSLHITDLDGSNPNDTVQEPRAQLSRLANALQAKGGSEKFPIITATTYPKLARLAYSMIGMEYAAATYFPATSYAAGLLAEIHDRSSNARARSKLPPTDSPEIESLVIPTQDFVERFAS